MASKHQRLSHIAFERLREQMATAAALCGDDQLLELADGLHDTLRRRRGRRDCNALGWETCPQPVMDELNGDWSFAPRGRA